MSRTRQPDAERVKEPRQIKKRAQYLRRVDPAALRDADNNADMQALNETINNRELPEVKR